MKSLQEYESEGGCEGCSFYQIVDIGSNGEMERRCTFHWYDDDSEDWEYAKNCDDMED